MERRSSTCAVFLLMAVGSAPLPARGLQLTCQLLLTPGGAGPPCFEVEPTGSCCQQKSVQIYRVAEGSLQAMPPGQREGLWGRSEGTAVQAGAEHSHEGWSPVQATRIEKEQLSGSELILGADFQQLGWAGWEANECQGSKQLWSELPNLPMSYSPLRPVFLV